MARRMLLSENELAVLKVLWGADNPMSRPEILAGIPDNDWNPNSIHSVLNNLIKKGYIEPQGTVRCGQGYGRTYAVTKNQGDYITNLLLNAVPERRRQECVLDFMMAMVDGEQIDEETIERLEQMLAQRRRELRQEKEGVKEE